MRLRTMMSVVAITLSAGAAWAAVAPSAMGAEGPPLAVPAEELERALGCSERISDGDVDPVVLVHGSATNASASWRSGYVFALAGDGIPACTVELPEHGMDDLQIASEFVVYAIRTAAERSGRPVSVVGHSSGGLEPLWALRFWPELRGLVTDVVALSAPYRGGPRSVCEPDCAPALWQAAEGSRFLAAATRAPLPDGPSFTSIATRTDGIVTPESAYLEGGKNIVLQDICPARPTFHGAMLYDSVAYALVLDARAHAGPAEPGRLRAGVCTGVTIATNTTTFLDDVTALSAMFLLVSATYPHVPAEPELFCYADPTSSRGVGTYCEPLGGQGANTG